MWNPPTDVELDAIPKLYGTKDIPLEEKVLHMHFFIGGSDWFYAEYNPGQRIAFGYAILNDDQQMAEWGYISHDELMEVKNKLGIEVDRDLHWKPKPAREIEKITNY